MKERERAKPLATDKSPAIPHPIPGNPARNPAKASQLPNLAKVRAKVPHPSPANRAGRANPRSRDKKGKEAHPAKAKVRAKAKASSQANAPISP